MTFSNRSLLVPIAGCAEVILVLIFLGNFLKAKKFGKLIDK